MRNVPRRPDAVGFVYGMSVAIAGRWTRRKRVYSRIAVDAFAGTDFVAQLETFRVCRVVLECITDFSDCNSICYPGIQGYLC
jgi:hypothetical protein